MNIDEFWNPACDTHVNIFVLAHRSEVYYNSRKSLNLWIDGANKWYESVKPFQIDAINFYSL